MISGFILMFVAFLGAAMGETMGQFLKHNMNLLLSFGGAFLLGLCFLHLLPEAFMANGRAGHWVIGGFLIQIALEYLSKGMEHGHVHGNRFGLFAFVSLCLHAFIESMPFGLDAATANVNHHGHLHQGAAGWPLLIGIGLHKLPVAIALMTILRATVSSKARRWIWVGIFSVVPLAGIALAAALPQDARTIGALNALLVGILLHIATTILFETADGHEFNGRKLLTVLLGLALSMLTAHLH